MSAKKMGFVKGEWVQLADSAWFAKLVSDVHTKYPVAFVLGWTHEAGSVYATDLVKIPITVQVELEQKHQSEVKPFKAPLVVDKPE
jgi:hypothetical protein